MIADAETCSRGEAISALESERELSVELEGVVLEMSARLDRVAQHLDTLRDYVLGYSKADPFPNKPSAKGKRK